MEVVQRKAHAAEVVALETRAMKESGTEEARVHYEEVIINMLHVICYCCGKEGHKASECRRHKNAKCHTCHKTGHLYSQCMLIEVTEGHRKEQSCQKENEVMFMHTVNEEIQQNLVQMNSYMAFFK